jgi:PTH1 family peptidyl-tRNA hydrolase
VSSRISVDLLIAGLGNPGPQYVGTRHNAGFDVAAAFLHRIGGGGDSFLLAGSPVTIITLEGRQYGVITPMRYMNRSGPVIVEAALNFELSPQKIVVIHDDIDLPLGDVRYKVDGGHGGHNGLRSIMDSLGSAGFKRIRVGVGRPAEGASVVDHVLSPFCVEEEPVIDKAIDKAVDLLLDKGIDAPVGR